MYGPIKQLSLARFSCHLLITHSCRASQLFFKARSSTICLDYCPSVCWDMPSKRNLSYSFQYKRKIRIFGYFTEDKSNHLKTSWKPDFFLQVGRWSLSFLVSYLARQILTCLQSYTYSWNWYLDCSSQTDLSNFQYC